MERKPGSGRGRRRHVFFGAAAVLLVTSLAACSVASLSPSPGGSPSGSSDTATASAPALSTPDLSTPTATPTTTATPTATATPTPTPTSTVAASPTPTDTLDEEPTDSPTPPLPKGPLPSVGPAPAGQWTGIKWIAIPGGHSPAVPAAPASGLYTTSTLMGSSKGYLEVLWDPRKRTLTPWFSPDGLRWKAGQRFNTSAWTAYLNNWTRQLQPNTADNSPDDCMFLATTFEEDPQTLLLRGYVLCGEACSPGPGVDTSPQAAWVSSDGIHWTPATIPDEIGAISGGPSGFVALRFDGSKASLWKSQDGRAWVKGALPPAVLASGASVGGPVAIAGGFVLPGVVVVKTGHVVTGAGCSGSENQSKFQAALWWSTDGTTWTRDNLSGANPTYDDIYVWLARIDDHTVVAIESTDNAPIEWVSGDGRSWTPINDPPVADAGNGNLGEVIAGRDRGLVYVWNYGSGVTLSVFNDKLALVTLNQTGELPLWDDSYDDIKMVMGPTGVLATDDGTRFWIGVPTAG
jgi:hypothetical protein